MPHRRPFALALFLTLAVAAADTVYAQAAAPSDAPLRLSVSAGVGLYGTGDEANCSTAPVLVIGASASTAGRWFASLSADVHQTPALACTSMLLLVPYGDGLYADEHGGSFFNLSPRLALHGGTRLSVSGFAAEAAAGAGMINSAEIDGDGRSWQPWTGGTLAVGRPGGRFALQGEHGRHRVTIRHVVYDYSALYESPHGAPVFVATHELHRWKPLTRIGIRMAW
jgi:hypothetical protein